LVPQYDSNGREILPEAARISFAELWEDELTDIAEFHQGFQKVIFKTLPHKRMMFSIEK